MDFSLWLFDFVTLKPDSLWKLIRTCHYPFSLPAASALEAVAAVVVVAAFPGCQKAGPDRNNNTQTQKFPIHLTRKSWTVGGSLSARKKSIQVEHADCTQKGLKADSRASVKSGYHFGWRRAGGILLGPFLSSA